jgi:hypothetical protein
MIFSPSMEWKAYRGAASLKKKDNASKTYRLDGLEKENS